MDLRRHAGDAHRLAQESRLFAIAFNQMHHRAGLIGERAGDRDAREIRRPSRSRPRSAPPAPAAAAAANWRRGGSRACGSVEGAMRLVFCCQSSSSSTNRSSRAAVSRETGVSVERARFIGCRDRNRPARACSSAFRSVAAAFHMRHQQRQRRRRDAVDAAGLADGARPIALAASAWLRWKVPAAPRNRDRPAMRNFHRADRPRRRPPGATDRHRTSHRSRSARRFSASSSPKRGQIFARSAIAIFGYDNSSNAVRR